MKKYVSNFLLILMLSSCSNVSSFNKITLEELHDKIVFKDVILLNEILDVPFLYESDFESVNPFENTLPVVSSDWKYDWTAKNDEFLSLIFPKEEYQWYQNICLEEKYALGAKKIDEKVQLRFLKYTDCYYSTPNAHLMPFYFEETYIVNNGVVSYCYDINITNEKQTCLENENLLKFISVVSNTKSLPYDIYFNDDYLLLINKDNQFSNSYMEHLMKYDDFYYLDV